MSTRVLAHRRQRWVGARRANVFIKQKMLAGFAGTDCAVMCYVRADRNLIIVNDQVSHSRGSRVTLLRGAEELVKDPLGLVDDAKVAGMTGLASFVCGRHYAHEATDTFEAPAPVVGGCIFGNVDGPRLGIKGAEPFGE